MHEMNLHEIQEAELNMLFYFDEVCKQYGLKYCLCAGTLLGAVRHKGFIPWDDDVDVFMPRPDFEKLIEFVEEINEKSSRYAIWGDGKGIMRPMGRVFDLRTKLEQTFSREEETGGHLWIDIFPVDGVPSDLSERKRLYAKAYYLKGLIGARYSKPMTGRSGLKALAKTLVLKPVSIVKGMDSLLAESKNLVQRYPYESSEYVGSLVWCTYREKECLPKSVFEDLVYVRFERGVFPIFRNFDLYLKSVYGDYLKLPDEKDRRPLHTEIVWGSTEEE